MPIAQLALNNNVSETTKETLFFLNYGKTPNLFIELKTAVKAEKAMLIADDLKEAYEEASRAIRKSQNKIIEQRHKESKTAP